MFRRFVNKPSEMHVDYSIIPDTVDLSQFTPDSERTRAFKFNPGTGDGTTPMYDYPDGAPKSEDDVVDDAILAIRSGKLDKADVPRVKEYILQQAKAKRDAETFKKTQEALNKTLGIDNDNSGSDKKN